MTDRNRVLETYRLFGVNEEARVLWDMCVGCLDDEEACAAATSLSSASVVVEVWDVARFVGRCAPRNSTVWTGEGPQCTR
jgi:hypothetical protein